jgi:cyclopropane-fatty-acyl-phospholipid synthase
MGRFERPTPSQAASSGGTGFLGRIWDLLPERLFANLECGNLTVILPNGRTMRHIGKLPGHEGYMIIHRWRVLRQCLLRGDLGFAESYLDGDWETPDLYALISLFAANNATMAKKIQGVRPARWLSQIQHALRANSRAGSRRNILAHYDLGNAFYRLWLDESMMYSSAIFETGETLAQAQQRKLARIEQLLDPQDGDCVLEIGCGWGALACHLARTTGLARLEGITLSPSQLEEANRRIAEAGLADRIAMRIEDYRDTKGSYDRIVSVEMIEAVGEKYMSTYFDTIAARLRAGGTAVIQAITISEDRFDIYSDDTDFIQQYIFPGGFLPSRTFMRQTVEKAGLEIVADETFGLSYTRTLLAWREQFSQNWPAIAALGFDARFHRLWDYYLSYCAAGFSEGAIDVGLYTIRHKAT